MFCPPRLERQPEYWTAVLSKGHRTSLGVCLTHTSLIHRGKCKICQIWQTCALSFPTRSVSCSSQWHLFEWIPTHVTASKWSTKKDKLGSILSINTNKDLKWQHRDTLGPTKHGSFVTARRQLPATGPEEPAGSRRFCTSGLRGREECGRGAAVDGGCRPAPFPVRVQY